MVVATRYSSSKEVFLMYRTGPYSWNEMNGLIIAVCPNEEVATFETSSVATAGKVNSFHYLLQVSHVTSCSCVSCSILFSY